jgi:hypothetical protein
MNTTLYSEFIFSACVKIQSISDNSHFAIPIESISLDAISILEHLHDRLVDKDCVPHYVALYPLGNLICHDYDV